MAGDHLTQVSFYDRLFDQALTSQYSLSIRFEPDGLSFSVYSHLISRYIGLESVVFGNRSGIRPGEAANAIFTDEMRAYIEQHPWLRLPFLNTGLIIHSSKYTLVPHVLYNSSGKETALGFAHQPEPAGMILEQFVSAAEAWIVFSVNRGLIELVNRFYPAARLMHHTGAVLETILPAYRHSELQNPVFVNVKPGLFDLIILRDGKLRYCNSFSWQAHEDLVYYLVFVLDQLSLNPESVPVLVCGNVEAATPLFELLLRYIRHVDFLRNTLTPKTGINLPETADYKFIDLLNPELCVS